MTCCEHEDHNDQGHDHQERTDFLLWGSVIILTLALIVHGFNLQLPYIADFGDSVAFLLKTMWWGMALGIVIVGFMQKVPREWFQSLLGRGDTVGGILRATLAGVLLDLCSHGILMVGAKLYERGVSIAQVMAFLIASPWNSLTLTIILISLIGLPWTLVFIAASMLIAVITGLLFMLLVKSGTLPSNPNTLELADDYDLKGEVSTALKNFKPSIGFFKSAIRDGLRESKMVLRWLFFGTIIAALIRSYVPTDMLITYFGPSILGLSLTLIATTIIEVCSEGSAPIGAELVTRAAAPGNGFAFLMAGVATDYTEILVIRQFTKSWKITVFLPLLTVPQILLLGWIMNMAAQ